MQYDFNKEKGKEAVLWRFVTACISSNAPNRQTSSLTLLLQICHLQIYDVILPFDNI